MKSPILLSCHSLNLVLHFLFPLWTSSQTIPQSNILSCQNYSTVIGNVVKGQLSITTASSFRCEFVLMSPDKKVYPFLSLTISSDISPQRINQLRDFIFTVYDHSTYGKGKIIFRNFDGNSTQSAVTVTSQTGSALISVLSTLPDGDVLYDVQFEFLSCLRNCSSHGRCINNRCKCDELWSGDGCMRETCPNDCTNIQHGSCEVYSTGKCKCFDDVIGMGCQLNTTDVTYRLDKSVTVSDDVTDSATRLTDHAASYARGYLWLFGGYNDETVAISNQLQKYDFHENEWTVMATGGHRQTGRYLHSMHAVEHLNRSILLVYGGITEGNRPTNEVLMYSIQSNAWRSKQSNTQGADDAQYSPKAAFQHASAIVEINSSTYLYVLSTYVTGSTALDRFDLDTQRWSAVTQGYTKGAKPDDLLLRKFVLTYDRVSHLLIFYGWKRADSFTFFFHLHTSQWSAIEPHRAGRLHQPISTQSTATVVSLKAVAVKSFVLIVEGDSAGASRVLFYNVRCNSRFEVSTIGGEVRGTDHALALMEGRDVLLLHGGVDRGQVTGALYAYQVPTLVRDPRPDENITRRCSRYLSKDLCLFDSPCQWCASWHDSEMGSCVNSLLPSCDNWSSGVPKLFVCRTVCTRLHDCEMCTSYSSYKLDDSYTRITTTCGWCASLQKCFPRINDDEDRDLCPETLLNDTCADENIPNGVYALRSYDGKSIPSEVLLIEDKLSIEISRPSRFQARGFLHWSVIKPETFAFNFYRFNGNVKFWLRDCSANMTIDGKDSNTDVVTLNDRKSTCTRSYGINQTTICELEIKFKYFGADTTGLFSFKKIADRKKLKMRLEPFRSGNKCASHVDCLSCAVDWSCAWCSLSHLCNNRMEMKFQPNSCSSQQEQDISVITNPTSCVVCNDSLTCRTCNSQQLCRWDQETNKCRTIDVGEKSMEETDGCPVVCEEHYTCSTCLHPTTCYWCGESETCHHKSSQQHLSCYQPLLSRHDCVSCDTKKSCYHCLENQRCGWCGSDVNPYQGYCSSVTDVRAEDCHLKSSQIHHNIYCPLMNECTWISESGETVHGCDVNADCTDMLWFNQCRCKRGYVGDGNTCQRTCYSDCGNGHCSGSPLFQCICNLGWTSTDLQSSQRCTVDCNCNLHSTCTEGVGICDLCMDNTRGRSCERCMRGYHRSVGNLKSSSCVSCDCNGHHSSGSSDVCDENTGECDCDQFTQGFNCQRCRDGYYGVSRNGGRCRLSCSDRLSLNETRGDFGVHNSSQYEFCYVIISSQQSSDVIRLNISRIYNIDCETTRLYIYNGMRNSSRLSVTFCDGLPDDGASVVSHTGQMLIMFESSAANSGFDAEYEILKVDDYNQPKYPSPSLFGNSLVYFNDSLLSFGGFSYEFSQKAIFRYRFEADTWSPVYSSPVGEEHPGARFLHASLVMGSDMYIYGGLTSDDYRVFADNRMWWRSLTDDDGTKHWERDDQTTTPGIPPQLARPSLVAMGSNKLLLLGGIRPVVTFNKQIWQFNIRTKRWRNMTGITLPIQQGIISLSAVYDEQQNSLFVFANVVAGNQSDSIFIACNLTSKSWTSLQRHLPAIINQPATRVSFSLGGGLLLFDGATSWLFLTSHLHWIDVSSITDGHLSHHNTDHASWYVHGNVSTDIKLFIYGGLLRGNISNHLQIVKMNVSCLAVTSSQECEVEMRQICQLKTCSSNTQVCKSKSSSTPSDDNLCKKFSFSKSFQSECLRFRTCYECSANDACGWCEDSCDGSRGKCVTKGTCRGSLRPRLSYGRIRTCKQQIPYHQKCGGDAEECGGGLLSGNCAYYRRCDECLRNNCSWVVLVDRCVSRAIERVVCVNSNCGRILHRNTGACRSNKCEGRRSCFTCLQAPGCVWGMAADGCSLSKLPLKQYWNDDDDVNPQWKFMACPIEDECGTGTHDCDRHEKCVDLPKGYECVCKDGYKPRPIPPLKCRPHCDQPCVSGTCVEPNICGCNLGFYGERCEKKCNCNGMSNCTDPVRCVKCVFNTFGRQCQYCKKGYVGDPTAVRLEDGASKVCNTCREVCNGRSDLCRGVNHRSNISEVTCDDCTGNSEGRLCEKCKDGFFELNGNCSRCLCHNLNGDRNVCDKETGTKCQCSEHAVSSKPECNQQSTTFVQCWKFQCDKCEAGYMGRPHTRSSPCYKWQPVNKQLCFDASDPTYCYDQTTKSLNQNRYQLQAGRSIRFAVKPRPLSKAKYRIHIKVLMGEVDVFVVVDQLTFFRITVDNSTGDEHVVGETDPIVTDRKNKKNKFTLKKFTARAQPNLNYHVTMGKHDAVQVESVSDRLIITRQGDHRDELIYVIILAKRTTNTRMKRQISGGGGDIVGASGNFIFRQDEPRLDLFVFFSCFFCSFGVISVFSTLVWKVRLAMSNRRARINQALQMIPLARRPCRLIYVLIDTSITVQTHSSVATTAANKTISSVTSSTVVTSTGCMASTSSSSSSSPHPSATHHRSILHKQDRSHVTSYPSRTIPLPHNTADHAIVVQNTDGSLRLTPEERDSSPCSSSSSSSWTQSSPVVAVRTPKSEMKSVRFAPSPDCLKRRHSSVPRIKASKQPLIMQPIYRNRSLSVVTYLAVMPGERATPIFISALASTDDTSAVFDDDELNEVDMKKHHRATIFSHFTSS